MKYFSLLVLICYSGHLLGQQFTVNIIMFPSIGTETKDSIYYSPARKLTWADFKGMPDANNPAVAITNSGFGFGLGAYRGGGRTQLNINVHCSFSKVESWVKKGYDNEYVLNHEQRHFDISWYCTNLFYKKLKAAKLTASNYNQVITDIYTESYTYLRQLQDAYDTETNNGILKDKQAEWNKKIDELLKKDVSIS